MINLNFSVRNVVTDYIDKISKNKTSFTENESIQRKNSASAFHFVDNRTEATPIQKALISSNNTSAVAQLASVGDVAQLGKKSAKAAATARNADKKAKTQSLGDRSYNNLCAYRPGWVRKNDITAAKVAAFRKTYSNGIRGHASGDNSQGEQGNTTADCLAYKSWHTTTYGQWH